MARRGCGILAFLGGIVIQFESFKIRNASPFKKVDLDLKKRGLVRLQGVNGAGKSTLWHQFTNVIHNTSPVKLSKNDMMLGDKEFLLEITFRKNGSQYVAAQAVKSKEKSPDGDTYNTGVYLFRDKQNISMHKDPDTQKLIKSTLGWTLEEWYGYVYLAQSTSHTLIHGTRSERQNYLSALFNLAPLDRLAKVYADKSDTLEEQIENLEKQKQEYAVKESLLAGRVSNALEHQILETQEELEAFQIKLKQVQRQQLKYEQKVQLENSLNFFLGVEGNEETLKNEIEELSKYQASLSIKKEQINSLDKQLTSLKIVPAVEIPEDWEEVIQAEDLHLKEAQDKLTALYLKKEKLQNLQAPEIPEDFEIILQSPDISIQRIQKEIDAIKSRPAPPRFKKPKEEDLQSLLDKKNKFNLEISNKQREAKHLEFHGTECPTCGTLLDQTNRTERLEEVSQEIEDLQVVLIQLDKKIKTAKDHLDAWRAYEALGPDRSGELPTLEKDILTYEKKLQYKQLLLQKEAYEKNLKDAFECEEIPLLSNRINKYQKKLEYKKLLSLREEHSQYLKEKTRIEKELRSIEIGEDQGEKLISLRALLDNLQQKNKIISQLESLSSAKDHQARIQSLETSISKYQVQIGSLQTELQEVRKLSLDLQELSLQISSQEEVYREKKKCDVLAKAFGKAGQLRERQLAKFSRYLEEALLAHTIRQLPEHRFKIVVDDGIDILTSKNGSKYYDVRTMSGGEKGALSVAFLFALDDLLPPDRRTSLKIIDELEANFDKLRKQDFINYTLPELRKRAETVVVISHSSAAEHGMFDITWEIENGEIIESLSEVREMERV